jgi:ribonuclease HII
MPSPKSSAARPAAPRPRRRGRVRFETLGFGWDVPGLVAGVDEAGRGPLAGPVVAAAVILDESRPIRGLADSKVLSEKRREQLYDQIRERALCCAVASASVEEIDTLNILQATLLAMRRAVQGLRLVPQRVVVDGNCLPTLPMLSAAVIDGDALVAQISAASILAKVERDRLCQRLHEQHPHYNFASHKGYSTPEHLAALLQHGPCAAHRRSFAPVREAWEQRAPVTFARPQPATAEGAWAEPAPGPGPGTLAELLAPPGLADHA